MRRLWGAVLAAATTMAISTGAEANLRVNVDTDSQTMEVYVAGKLKHRWRVSTGRDGYETPSGSYRPQRLEREWYSRTYDDAPMPNSIFFSGGYAIHGTYDTGRLGRPASRGYVRLAPSNARQLYDLVATHRGATRIVID